MTACSCALASGAVWIGAAGILSSSIANAGGSTLDPIALPAGLAVLAVVSGIAAYWPARRIGIEFIRLKE